MNHLVIMTGGATVNYIDAVRYISSKSSGSTVLSLHDRLWNDCDIHLILPTYIIKRNNLYNDHKHVIWSYASNQDLENAIKASLNLKPKWFIHAASVSDYIPESVSNEKISSNQEELIVKLVKAPKIVDRIKEWCPETNLVSFKAGSPELTDNELIKIARKQLIRTSSTLVWANKLNDLNRVFLVNRYNEHILTRPAAIKTLGNIIREDK